MWVREFSKQHDATPKRVLTGARERFGAGIFPAPRTPDVAWVSVTVERASAARPSVPRVEVVRVGDEERAPDAIELAGGGKWRVAFGRTDAEAQLRRWASAGCDGLGLVDAGEAEACPALVLARMRRKLAERLFVRFVVDGDEHRVTFTAGERDAVLQARF